MARISDAELARLKAEVSVQRLVEGCGVELRAQGKDLVGCCPFHEDDSPSLVVTPAKNLWHCMGACGRGGGPIDWVMTAQGVSFRHAVELLRESSPALASLAQPGPRSTAPGPVARSKTAKLPSLVAPDAADQELLSCPHIWHREAGSVASATKPLSIRYACYGRPPVPIPPSSRAGTLPRASSPATTGESTGELPNSLTHMTS